MGFGEQGSRGPRFPSVIRPRRVYRALVLSRLLAPKPTPYDPLAWRKLPFEERARLVAESWALDGYGTPTAAYGFYFIKMALYVGGFFAFSARSPELGDASTLATWWAHPLAFQKAVLWSMAFEGLGLGCGSGPLTGRYFPPLGGFLHFLRPGTTKLPLFPSVPLLGGRTRSVLDVALYAAIYVLLARALLAPTIDRTMLLPLAAIVPLAAIGDRTVFLAMRGEHYFTTLVCFAAAADFLPGAKAVQLALWFWAGVSKLNHHFPYVVAVMTSNSPVTRAPVFRRAMYRSYPDDLNPSTLAVGMSHVGTALELGVPLILAFATGGPWLVVGLTLMVLLHGFITSNVPMGVPLEWNVMVVYGAFVLFGAHADVSAFSVREPLLVAFLAFALVAVPLVGNLVPSRVSFLLSMRYYAGNWPYGVWLFRGDSYRKLDRLKKSSAWIYDQLDRFYDRATSYGLVGKVVAFRLMHLHGRALSTLLPKAVPAIEDYEYLDGELVAGMALGWNFGDGHLHHEALLESIQAQCGFEAGELRCIFVEPEPLLGGKLAYRIRDAATGLLEEGELAIAELRRRQPHRT